MNSPLERDQEDIFERLRADAYFADVPVLLQRKGVIESDVATALGSLNEHTGKAGCVAIVLMPALQPEPDNTPAPTYKVRHSIQVIETPSINSQPGTGIGKSAEAIAHRLRQILQWYHDGSAGSLAFDGMEPSPVPEGSISYVVYFARRDGDQPIPKVARPMIAIVGDLPATTVTLNTATPSAAIYYTTDGSYPSPLNPGATLYTEPFVQATAATIRAAAVLADHQQSDVRQMILT